MLDFLNTSSSSEADMMSFSSCRMSLGARLLQRAILLLPIVAVIESLPCLADAQSESDSLTHPIDAQLVCCYYSDYPHVSHQTLL